MHMGDANKMFLNGEKVIVVSILCHNKIQCCWPRNMDLELVAVAL